MATRFIIAVAVIALLGAARTRGMPEFRQVDANGDGIIEPNEMPRKSLFDRIDTDKSGTVTKAEFDEYTKVLPSPPAIDKTEHRDIVYYDEHELNARHINHTHLVSLDIYQPKHGKDLPVVVYVHGGSWQFGDKLAVASKPDYFLASGFVFASVNYRLRPAVGIETLQQDVAAAVAWVHAHIEDHGGDPHNIFLLSHSAGAHEVSIVGTRRALLAAHGLDLSALAGVVELDTMALDVNLMMETGKPFYGPIFGTDPKELTKVSPYDNIEPERNTPPFMFVVANGNERKLMQSKHMAKKLASIGVTTRIIEAPNRTHGTLNRSLGGIGDKYGPEVLAFMRNHLR